MRYFRWGWESCAFVYMSLENVESTFGFASPGTAQPLVLLHSSPAGCGSGALPAAAHPDGSIEFQSNEMSWLFLWSLYLNINWSQKKHHSFSDMGKYILLVSWIKETWLQISAGLCPHVRRWMGMRPQPLHLLHELLNVNVPKQQMSFKSYETTFRSLYFWQ